jgi:hypothetical protein
VCTHQVALAVDVRRIRIVVNAVEQQLLSVGSAAAVLQFVLVILAVFAVTPRLNIVLLDPGVALQKLFQGLVTLVS